ncbi:MAG: cobyrinate a,c-diamide synthase [Myxococcaceae bacterium]
MRSPRLRAGAARRERGRALTTRCPRLVVAGTHSGAGKTSVALALTSALRRRGLVVQPFKVGPDYLDPTYLTVAAGRPCYNLDGWMAGREYVCGLFERASAGADVAIVEGAMGLFDGADPAGSEGSTAEIARWLQAPVVLVVDAHGAAGSLAATVEGFSRFDPDVKVEGVIANRIGGDGHRAWLAQALEARGLPALLGAVPRGAFPALPCRHLGLLSATRGNLTSETLGALADALERAADLARLIDLAGRAPPLESEAGLAPVAPRQGARLGVAFDEAFHFYYPDNLEALERCGAELVRFSPLEGGQLPEGVTGLYFGGGYPEAHAAALAANGGMSDAIRRFAASGRPLYAECGGLMYLAEGIELAGGERHRMVGLVPSWTRMLERRKALGYVEVTLTSGSLFGEAGTKLRGHEFHYSELVSDPLGAPGWSAAYSVARRRTGAVTPEGFQRGRVLASYVHAHFASRPQAAERFIAACGSTH